MSTIATDVKQSTPRRLVRNLTGWLPKGGSLPEEDWASRHRAITWLLAGQGVGLFVFGWVRGYPILHLVWESLIPILCAVIAQAPRVSRERRAVVATFGLVAVSGLFVHLSGGTIEGHFHFFVMLAVISLYQEWRTFLLAILFVALHHGVVGTLDPEAVYNHASAVADPWSWALIHATLVLAESLALVVAWRFSEQAHEHARAAGQLLIEEAQRRRDEQAEARAELERREAQLQEAQRIARVGSWDWDLATNAVESSDELLRLFGVHPGIDPEPDFTSLMNRIHPEDRPGVDEAIERALVTRQPYSIEFRIVKPDGSVSHVMALGQVITNAEGIPQRMVGTCQDVTERMLLEMKLMQSQKMEAIGQLAGGIAHDFNNLLAIVTNYGRFARDELAEGSPVRDDVEQIIQAGEKGAKLTHQLLTFSRKEVVKPVVLNPADHISEIQKLLSRTIREDIHLSTKLCPNGWLVKIDRGEFEQILMNLAVNSKDAMPEGGALIIEADNVIVGSNDEAYGTDLKPGEYVRIQVSDTGCGMDKTVQSRIFEPFFTTKNIGQGTGLGLATIYAIVQRAGGSISVYSEVGKGSTFKVHLPRCVDAVDEESRESESEELVGGNGEMVLVVEDEAAVLELTTRILSSAGYDVLTAINGDAALDVLATQSVDVLVTDVVMPGMSGRELSERAGLKTVFMSGYTNQLIDQQGILARNDVLVQKPFKPNQLLIAVRNVLDAPVTAKSA
ncbi:MAG TPA: ATP-binding protein [Actinomycetota bacterium]|nr:ATP-binding protein [Actinomycetota bacterium]